MILIGGYFSPFVRRSAVTLREYGIPYEYRPLKVWDEADEVKLANPLGRVPALILDFYGQIVDPVYVTSVIRPT